MTMGRKKVIVEINLYRMIDAHLAVILSTAEERKKNI